MRYPILKPLALLVGALGLASAHAAAAPDGKTIAMQGAGGAPCQSCHGANGEGNAAAGFPSLAGMNAAYLESQLHAFKNGTRKNPVMAPQASGLNDAQIKAVSDYYAGLEPSKSPSPNAPADQIAAGAQLAQIGRWDDNIPACIQCHGPHGQGIPPHFPGISGQHASYIESQLKAWQTGQRSNDPNGLMGAVAKRLSDADIKAVAAYFASQPATEADAKH